MAIYATIVLNGNLIVASGLPNLAKAIEREKKHRGVNYYFIHSARKKTAEKNVIE